MRTALWNARHMSQLLAASVYPRDSYLALKALRHVALFVWLIKNFMRENESSGVVCVGSCERYLR